MRIGVVTIASQSHICVRRRPDCSSTTSRRRRWSHIPSYNNNNRILHARTLSQCTARASSEDNTTHLNIFDLPATNIQNAQNLWTKWCRQAPHRHGFGVCVYVLLAARCLQLSRSCQRCSGVSIKHYVSCWGFYFHIIFGVRCFFRVCVHASALAPVAACSCSHAHCVKLSSRGYRRTREEIDKRRQWVVRVRCCEMLPKEIKALLGES